MKVVHGRVLLVIKGKEKPTILLVFLNKECPKMSKVNKLWRIKSVHKRGGSIRCITCTFANPRLPCSVCGKLNLAKAVLAGRPGRAHRRHWVLVIQGHPRAHKRI